MKCSYSEIVSKFKIIEIYKTRLIIQPPNMDEFLLIFIASKKKNLSLNFNFAFIGIQYKKYLFCINLAQIPSKNMESQLCILLNRYQMDYHSQMIRSQYLILTFLALLALEPTLINAGITTTNDYNSLSKYCTGSPYWSLNHCNISCATCLSNDQTKCLTCENNFTLSSVYCILTNDTNTYILQQYFSSTTVSSSDLTLWSNSAVNKKLTTSNTVSICYTNSYNFGMVGLFGKDDKLNIQLTYANQMNYLTLKFNLLLLVNKVSLEIDIGQKPIYTQTFSSLSDLDATYYSSTNDSISNILYVPSLTSTNYATILQAIKLDTSIATKDINLYFSVAAGTRTNFWAISDVSILLRQCDTCPTAEVMSTIESIGNITLYTTAVTVPLILIFWISVKIKEHFEKLSFRKRKGGKHLPNKAMNRVIQAVRGSWKNPKITTTEEDKNYQTINNKLKSEQRSGIMKRLISQKHV